MQKFDFQCSGYYILIEGKILFTKKMIESSTAHIPRVFFTVFFKVCKFRRMKNYFILLFCDTKVVASFM